jgi:hypothetical protein
MDSRPPENPPAKQLDELPPCWLEFSGCCRRIGFLPMLLLIQKHGGGAGVSCRECGGGPGGDRLGVLPDREPSSCTSATPQRPSKS